MANSIAELSVGIRADAGGMKSGLAQASGSVRSFGSMVSKLAGPIAAAFGVSRVVGFSAAIIQSADAVSEQARAIGASVEGMIGLHHAASIAGVSVEDITQNMRMMEKRMGAGDSNNAIKKLGLDAMALRTMGADKAVMEVAGALGTIQNPSQRAALAMEMFGRGGLKMLQMSAEGKDNLKAMAQEAEDLGLTLNGVEAKKFEDINDNFTRMKGAIKGVAQTFLLEMGPAILGATEKLVEFGKYINKVFSKGAEQDITALGAAFKVWQDAISGGVEGGARAAGFEQFADNMSDIAKGQEEMDAAAKKAKIPGMFASIAEAMKKFEEASTLRGGELTEKFGLEDFAAQRTELNNLLRDGFIDKTIFDAAMKDIESKDPVTKWFQSMLDAGQAALDKQKGMADSLTESMLTPWEKAQQEMQKAEELKGKGLISEDTYARAIAKGMESSPMAEMEKQRTAWFEQMMNDMPKEAERQSIEALSGGDIIGQVRRGQLGGAMDLQQEQLNTQKRMEKWLAILAGGGVTPAFSWGR